MGSAKAQFELGETSALVQNLLLKTLLNAHSTLEMTLLGRVEGNVMTHVKASNLKLIDRAYRYVDHFLRARDVELPKEIILREIFSWRDQISLDDAIVRKATDSLLLKVKGLQESQMPPKS